MQLSESLRRNVMETVVGGVLNKFKIKNRRNVLFFEDILANYVKGCEDAGYGEEMKAIGQKWCILIMNQLTTKPLRKLPIKKKYASSMETSNIYTYRYIASLLLIFDK